MHNPRPSHRHDAEYFYIMSPLFNQKQVRLIQQIEHTLDICDHQYFSPRQSPGAGPISTPEQAQQIYDSNLAALHQCSAAVCVLDYLLPESHEMRLISLDNAHRDAITLKRNLKIPDTGVVFEMGYMAALKKPVVLLVPGDGTRSDAKYNVMLTRSLAGYVIGTVGLSVWGMENREDRWCLKPGGHLYTWKGGEI